MKAFNLKSVILATVTGAALMAAPAMAGHGDGHHHKGFHKMQKRCDMMGHGMFRGLDLTDEQKSQIKTLVKAQKESMRAEAKAEQRADHRDEMHTLITSPQFDKVKAEQLIAEQQQKRQQNMLARLETQNQIYNLLTAEQQQKLQERMEKCPNRGKKS